MRITILRKSILPFFTIICFTNCSVKKEQNLIGSSAAKLNGVWTEDWKGTGERTDVTYTDTIQIKFTDNKIVMKCLNNNNYLYSEIFFNDDKFNFRMENVADPNEEFLVYYKLKISKDVRSM